MIFKRLNSLFFKAVVFLILISIVPGFIIGFHVLGVDSRILKNEILQKQQTVARRILSVASASITYQQQMLSSFVDLHTIITASGHSFFSEEDLSYLQARNPALFYLAVLDSKGKVALSSGKLPAEIFASVKAELLQTALAGKTYLSDVFRVDEKLFVWIAEPFYQKANDKNVLGMFVAAVNLQEMGNLLLQAYPLDMRVMLVSSAGDVISYNGAPDGLALTPQPAIEKRVQEIDRALEQKTSGEIVLGDKERLLVSVAQWPAMEWMAYVEQPANVVPQLLKENTFNSIWDIFIIIVTILIFVVIVSYLVIMPITRPLSKLRAAAVKLRDEDDVVIEKENVEIPNNEIGELASVFVEMSHVLHNRRHELVKAQEELAKSNQILEKRVEERTRKLKETTRELVKTERLAAIGQMASIISHEIRNPLAVISNATRLIKMLVHNPDVKLNKQFGIIETEIRQANSIISEVLGYARSRELMLSAIEVNSYIKEIFLSYPMPQGISLREELAAESVRIKVDAEEIKQAIRNIISNAVEAMGGEGTLTVGTRVGKKLVCIYISDTGPGVSEEIRKKMFAPFFTTKARGTGLGLAVVGKAMMRHKGKLFISSKEGQGTCFQIYLKIYRKAGDTVYGEAS